MLKTALLSSINSRCHQSKAPAGILPVSKESADCQYLYPLRLSILRHSTTSLLGRLLHPSCVALASCSDLCTGQVRGHTCKIDLFKVLILAEMIIFVACRPVAQAVALAQMSTAVMSSEKLFSRSVGL